MATMKAARYCPPGGPETIKYEDVAIPSQLGPDEVLIKVHAASVVQQELTWPVYENPTSHQNEPHIPCHDFSGVIVRMGSEVAAGSELEVGAEVHAFTSYKFKEGRRSPYEGAAAEYAVADMNSVVLKPETLRMIEAATIPLSALTAWQALHDQGNLQKGQRLLITGVGGPTGLWAVQFAKMVGAYVVGTASSEWSFETLRKLGIDEMIDYKKQSIEGSVSDIDLILDTIGKQEALPELVRILKPEGQIVSITDYVVHDHVLKGVRAKFFIVSMEKDQLKQIDKMIEQGKLQTFIDSVYPLDKVVDAFKKGQKGHLHGKVVLSVAS